MGISVDISRTDETMESIMVLDSCETRAIWAIVISCAEKFSHKDCVTREETDHSCCIDPPTSCTAERIDHRELLKSPAARTVCCVEEIWSLWLLARSRDCCATSRVTCDDACRARTSSRSLDTCARRWLLNWAVPLPIARSLSCVTPRGA